MGRGATHTKLGLFAVLALAAAIVTAFGLGARSLRGETVVYHAYFDESVAGLEVGAPVKYRGILLGAVEGVAVAPDRRHVDVTLELQEVEVRRAGLAEPGSPPEAVRLAIPRDLRAQLGTQGITGVKFLLLDFVDPSVGLPPSLPFEVAENHIPTAPSFMKALEENVSQTAARLPEIAETTLVTLQTIEILVEDVHRAGLPTRATDTLRGVDGAIADLRRVLRDVDRAKLPEKTAATIDSMNLAATRVNSILDKIDGEGGLVASSKRATDAVGDLGRSAADSTDKLDRTLRDLSEAAQAVRDLAESLERDPDMLLQGRGVPTP